jgi:hypothetical protein
MLSSLAELAIRPHLPTSEYLLSFSRLLRSHQRSDQANAETAKLDVVSSEVLYVQGLVQTR